MVFRPLFLAVALAAASVPGFAHPHVWADVRETAVFRKGYFDYLKSYKYFTLFWVGNTELGVPEPEQFQASITPAEKVCYRFFLPLGLRLGPKSVFSVSFYDDQFFTDMVFEKIRPLILTVKDGGSTSVSLRPDKSKSYFAGQVTPVFAFITWSSS